MKGTREQKESLTRIVGPSWPLRQPSYDADKGTDMRMRVQELPEGVEGE